MNTPLIPLVVIAAEVGVDADTLAARLGDEVTHDTIGVRCCSVDRGRQLIADYHDALRAKRERVAARQAELAANDPVQALRRRLRARPPATSDVPAVALAMAAEHENRGLDEMLRPAGAPMLYHSLTTGKDG